MNESPIQELCVMLVTKPNIKVLYIVPSMEEYRKTIQPELIALLDIFRTLNLTVHQNCLRTADGEGYVMFRTPESEVRGLLYDLLILHSEAKIPPDDLGRIMSQRRQR